MLKTLISRQAILSPLIQRITEPFQKNVIQPCICRYISTSRVNFVPAKEDEEVLGHDKILKVRVASTRLDLLLKVGLGISRNKIEKTFYDDRIRINGVRPKKKSQTTNEGDELDIVRGTNKINPLFLDVNRIEILEIGDSEGSKDDDEDQDTDDEGEGSEKFPITIKRSKNLTIENYPVPWKGGASE